MAVVVCCKICNKFDSGDLTQIERDTEQIVDYEEEYEDEYDNDYDSIEAGPNYGSHYGSDDADYTFSTGSSPHSEDICDDQGRVAAYVPNTQARFEIEQQLLNSPHQVNSRLF